MTQSCYAIADTTLRTLLDEPDSTLNWSCPLCGTMVTTKARVIARIIDRSITV